MPQRHRRLYALCDGPGANRDALWLNDRFGVLKPLVRRIAVGPLTALCCLPVAKITLFAAQRPYLKSFVLTLTLSICRSGM